MNQPTYLQGDLGHYTGKTEMLHGGLFYCVLMAEGRRAGQIAYTQRAPDGKSPTDGQAMREWKDQQAQFARLHRKEENNRVFDDAEGWDKT